MAPCQILLVLLLGLSLQFCNCSRQIRDAAEQQNIRGGHRLLQDTYMPSGAPSANHDEMAGAKTQSFTRLTDEMVEKKPTSELPLSGKQKQLNMKLKGHEAPDSFIINTSPKLKAISQAKPLNSEYLTSLACCETEILRKSLSKSRERSSSRRRSFLGSSQSAEDSMNSTAVSSPPENQYSAGGEIMEMDYSPAHRKPPIHNEVSLP
ncbi:hypothetical protein SUGI_0323760 [Cryptomeria japonica]|uniref:uncharacterized protein LOC131066357 n=1 Tax=Cryptomeria japonica TaxID=3369 RepID=UPI002408967A|nr:uncharacterized protein LOC131066357 [Cryptomeria japonica]GLJ18297.1 hypothetical protein SUGI_0323760 [Cryptomeria japonica]